MSTISKSVSKGSKYACEVVANQADRIKPTSTARKFFEMKPYDIRGNYETKK